LINSTDADAFSEMIYAGLFFMLFAFVYAVIIRHKLLARFSSTQVNYLFLILLAVAGLARMALVVKVSGQPPAANYALWLSHVKDALIIHSKGISAWNKLFPIITDMMSIVLLYRLALKYLPIGTAFGLAVLYALNPAALFHSAVWGQTSTYYVLLLLVIAYGCNSWKKFKFGTIALMLLSLLTLSAGYVSISYLRPWYGLATVLHHILNTDSFASMNGFNLLALTGGNGLSAGNERLFFPYTMWAGILLISFLGSMSVLFWRKYRRLNPAKIYFLLLIFVVAVFMLAINMRVSYLFIALPFILLCFITSKDRRWLQLFAGFTMTHYVNMNYAYGFSLSHSPTIPNLNGILLAFSFINVVLLSYLVYIGYDFFVKERLLTIPPGPDELAIELKLSANPMDLQVMKITHKDWVWMLTLALLYGLLAFYHLGSMKSPVTAWQPVAGDSFYVDLGSPKHIDRINIFSGIGDGTVMYEFAANDPSKWNHPIKVNTDYVSVFKWITQNVDYTARYVKITVVDPGITMNELAIFQKDDPKPLTIQSIHPDQPLQAKEGHISDLFDEQKDAVYKPTYMNETYFDEIYHARAAYENLHGIKPYENTHPPLGKLLIAVGVKIFGMNPFGWRVVGTLFGIGMLPLIYIFAKRLIGKSEYALIAEFLMACDFMHFAQTRIATIDVYGVFFIMLMFYYMMRFYRLSFYKVSLWTTLRPLFWAGLFFGIGAACKWIALYGGAGLALIFFLVLYDRYKEYDAAKKLVAEEHGNTNVADEVADTYAVDEAKQIVRLFPRLAVKTMAWCSLFFILIPAIIYSLSFVPIMAAKGQAHTLKQLVQYQVDMYEYHSNLVATHPFSSPWWEWPMMVRPIWYYSGADVSAGNVSTIVSFGNPAIWWLGFLAVFAALFVSRRRKDKAMSVILIAYLSQYVPWLFVSRLTFIYHYFAMVPFLILCIVYMMKVLLEHNPDRKKYIYMYLSIVLLLFVMFYPALSGLVVNGLYVDYFLHWFPSWTF